MIFDSWRHLQGTKKQFHAVREAPTFGEVSSEGEGVPVVAEIEHCGEVTCDTGQQ